MHELSVTENLLAIALKYAHTGNATRVTSVNLVIGQLSSIVDDSVQFYWDIITEKTLCAGSSLFFQRIPAIFQCKQCNFEYELVADLTACPKCGSFFNEIKSGEEFYVDSIDIEEG